jgi:heme-degrading monooxygenase HmoA
VNTTGVQGGSQIERVAAGSSVPATHSGVPLVRAVRSVGSVAVLVLVDFRRDARLWAWTRLALRDWPLRREPGLRFAKVMGSGQDGGFGVRPSATHQGLFLSFDDEAAAQSFIDHSALLRAYRGHAEEALVAVLRVGSCRGSWSGTTLEVGTTLPPDMPLVSLTRASIRARHAAEFWRMAPPAEQALESVAGCRLAVGLGEAPILRQCTVSLWDDKAAMDAYARHGAHQQAIRAAYGGHYFSESMFARFLPLRIDGVWKGQRYGH